MTNSDGHRSDELINEALGLPYGELRTKLLEEAVRDAEVCHNDDLNFYARIELFDSAGHSGDAEKSFASFAWCLAKFESDPDRFRAFQDTILWDFKRSLHLVYEFPQISHDQVSSLFIQMASLYRRCGCQMRTVDYMRFVVATRNGDRHLASEAMAKFQAEPRDDMADNFAVETNVKVEYYDLVNDFEQAISAAVPILDGHLCSTQIPHLTYGHVLRSLAQLGQYELGDECQRKGYRLIRGNPAFLRQIGMQMAYLVHRDRIPAALNMLQRHLSWAHATRELASRYYFYLAARRVLDCLEESETAVKLNFPRDFSIWEPSSQYEVATLRAWFDERINELGRRFDARNRNNFFTAGLIEQFDY